MKRTAIIAALALAVLGTGYGLAMAHGGYSYGNNYGHMGGYYGGHMMDYAGPGYGSGYCGSASSDLNLTRKDAEEIIAYRVTRDNPNLKVGDIKGTEDGFEVQVVTKKGGALVDRLLVEKDTGRIYRVYE